MIYVDVFDIDATITRAKELGAEISMGKMEIAPVGWGAFFGDPGGNRPAILHRKE